MNPSAHRPSSAKLKKFWAYKMLGGKGYMVFPTRREACGWTAEIPRSERIVRVELRELPRAKGGKR